MKKEDLKYQIILGNPCDGFYFYGPFDNFEAAADMAVQRFEGDEWWIAELYPIDVE